MAAAITKAREPTNDPRVRGIFILHLSKQTDSRGHRQPLMAIRMPADVPTADSLTQFTVRQETVQEPVIPGSRSSG
jgi:hypothetical protein